MRELYLEEKDTYGSYNNLDETSSRYVFWFITKHGPFKSYLYDKKLADNDWCRYCHLTPETPFHLMSETTIAAC